MSHSFREEHLARCAHFLRKRQFDRITEKWGLRKNMRKEEMIVIVRTQRERARKGKPTAVRIHGQELLGAKIARWEQRHRDGKELLEFDPSAACEHSAPMMLDRDS